jgi:hypothetical protein
MRDRLLGDLTQARIILPPFEYFNQNIAQSSCQVGVVGLMLSA